VAVEENCGGGVRQASIGTALAGSQVGARIMRLAGLMRRDLPPLFSRCHRRNWPRRSAFHSARALSMNARRATFRRGCAPPMAREFGVSVDELLVGGRNMPVRGRAACLKRSQGSHARSRRRSLRFWKPSSISAPTPGRGLLPTSYVA
jgi:hypothetical protein